VQENNRPKIGLALGSGGLRGLAHIGAIKVLLKNKIPIDYISGASSGALVGAYLAVYGEVNSLEKLILKEREKLMPLFVDFSLLGGFINGKKINEYLKQVFNDANFSDTKIPLNIITTDLVSGQAVYFSSGRLIPAIRGSISVPIVFKPLDYEDKVLVDGGLSDPVPVDILKKNKTDKIIAINLYHKNEFKNNKFTVSKVALRSTRIALYNLAKISVSNADIVLNPDLSHISNIKFINYFDKKNIKNFISLGEKEALKKLPEIKKMLTSTDKINKI